MEIKINLDWAKVYFFIVLLFNLLLFLAFGYVIFDSNGVMTIWQIICAITTFIALITNIVLYVLIIWGE